MYFFIRQFALAFISILLCAQGWAQSSRCDSIQWTFDVNQFAIDGDNLLADFAEKGWTPDFFQTNAIDVTIYGATDCPGSFEYNTNLAGYRAQYLLNYFEVSAFPYTTVASSYIIPERNCISPGQGYNREDRVTALKVCWTGSASPTEAKKSKEQPREKPEVTQEKTETEERVEEVVADVTPVEIQVESVPDPAPDSAKVVKSDAGYELPTKPKKTFNEESTPELNKGDEVIVEGLNFYPGSHRTLPEAKPILKKLLQMMKDNPTLQIEIQGHVCCASKPNEDGLDDETGDFKLSWNRAQYVRDYLIQNGIAESRISFRGFAMTRPLVFPEKTIQDQIKNRRVEILITAE
jgi:outer membrane protein OmpA-like peptidoglycan-associated protein